jgi:phosphoribosylglycinamide formyltransferase-1
LNSKPQQLVLFASGSGSNAMNVIAFFANNPGVQVAAVFCNNPKAGIIEKIKSTHVPLVLFNKAQFENPDLFLPLIQTYQPALIALLGFLWKVPSFLIQAYPQQILNLHPALLPKYGGKGMYGHHVHEAVKLAGETETGISLHYVNEHYDEGKLIAQFKTPLSETDTSASIAEKIHQLEQKHVPVVIESILLSLS